MEHPKKTEKTVAFCIAGYFWPHVAASIASLISYNKNISIHLFYEIEDVVWKGRLEKIVRKKNSRIYFHLFQKHLVEGFKMVSYLGLGAYYRIFLPRILNMSSRILYLDSDTIVADSLEELWDLDLEDNMVAARPSCELPFQEMCNLSLGKDKALPYLNSGVLLIDVNKWNGNSTTEKIIDFIKGQPEKLLFADQCAINFVLSGKFKFLHPSWNVSYSDWGSISTDIITSYEMSELKSAMDHPKIIHFNGPLKPWSLDYPYQKRFQYIKHRRAAEGNILYIADDFFKSLPSFVFKIFFRRIKKSSLFIKRIKAIMMRFFD